MFKRTELTNKDEPVFIGSTIIRVYSSIFAESISLEIYNIGTIRFRSGYPVYIDVRLNGEKFGVENISRFRREQGLSKEVLIGTKIAEIKFAKGQQGKMMDKCSSIFIITEDSDGIRYKCLIYYNEHMTVPGFNKAGGMDGGCVDFTTSDVNWLMKLINI